MKNTFAVTMTLLLALTLGGSYAAFKNGTHEEKPVAEATENTTSQMPASQMPASQTPANQTPASQTPASAGEATGGETGQPPAVTAEAARQGADQQGAAKQTTMSGAAGAAAMGTAATGAAATGTTAGGTPAAGAAATGSAATPANTPRTDKTIAVASAASTGDAGAGKTKFTVTCAGCHGANAEGGVGPALKVANTWTLGQFTAALREGHAPDHELSTLMPRFTPDAVSDTDLANLHAYVQTLN